MSYTDRVVLLWELEDADFIDRVNCLLANDEVCEFEDIKYHAISIRDSSRFVNPTVQGGRQCGEGAMMFCQGFDLDGMRKLINDLKPQHPESIRIIWTSEHGDPNDVHVEKLESDELDDL